MTGSVAQRTLMAALLSGMLVLVLLGLGHLALTAPAGPTPEPSGHSQVAPVAPGVPAVAITGSDRT